MTVDTFIPNDTKILDDGKDVYMSHGGFLSYDNKLIFLSYEQWFNLVTRQSISLSEYNDSSCAIYFSGKINIITGPNFSGKSIYIKQVCYVF